MTILENEIFSGCNGLSSITIPNSVISIKSGAFQYCKSLTSITIPNSVTSVGSYAFDGCVGLTSLTIGNSVTNIGGNAFRGCSSLTFITIPNSVKSIEYYAFDGCNFSKVISLISEPFSIYNHVFNNNTLSNATLIVPYGTISKYKSTIGWRDFVRIEEGSPTGSGEQDEVKEFTYNDIKYTVLSQADLTVEVAAGKGTAGEDGSVKNIGDMVIPSTVTYAGKTYTVVGIGESAFINYIITSLSLPNTLTYIGKGAFSTCMDLKSITIPQSVTTIGTNAFWATSISEMIVMNPVPIQVPYNAFIYLQDYNDCVLYVPAGSSNAYRNANEWRKFSKIVEMQKEPDKLDGHEYVDLGLPSGKCWATMNYGATTPEGYGSYLEWSYNNIISANWGSGWTTPSLQDIIELENNCTWTWGQKNGHNGYIITGKNGNSIFLPASGFQMSGQSSAKKVGDWVHYWTSTPSDDMAYTILSSSSGVAYGCTETTYSKLPIRPVTKNAIIVEVDDTDEYVDLGLPSGLLWATRNVGSNRPEEFGSYFAWGETTPKDSYNWDTYKYANGSNTSLTKYCTSYSYGKVDYIEVLEEKDDAATANWGKPWRTPTLIETQELINKCKWSSTTRNGVNGYTVTGPNGNSIFIPAAGIMVNNVPHITADACLQTATIFNADNGNPASASVLYIEKGTPHKWYGWDRCWGYSVRPVMSADQTKIPVASADVENEIIGIYDLRGHKLDNLQKGINIVKYKNGEFKKVSK